MKFSLKFLKLNARICLLYLQNALLKMLYYISMIAKYICITYFQDSLTATFCSFKICEFGYLKFLRKIYGHLFTLYNQPNFFPFFGLPVPEIGTQGFRTSWLRIWYPFYDMKNVWDTFTRPDALNIYEDHKIIRRSI